MPRILLIAITAALAGATAQATPQARATQAKTLNVNWREYKDLVGGQLNFRITKIVVTPTNWSITATVANRSPYTLSITRPKINNTPPNQGIWFSRDSGFGLADYTGTPGGGFFVHPNQHARPTLPTSLKPNGFWQGTFSGKASIPTRRDLRVSFGWFTISAAPDTDKGYVGQQFNWITDHSFRL